MARDKQTNKQIGIITLLAAPRKNEEPAFVTGLKAKDEVLMSSKKLSLLLSECSKADVELLLLPLEAKGNFPVVGDGCACSAKSVQKHIFIYGNTNL